MGLTYTVKKSKASRMSFRIMGIIFILLGILGMVLVWRLPSMRYLVISVAAVAGFYGVYLLKSSLRQQAYDITYEFTEEYIKLKLHNKEKLLPYTEVLGVKWIEPTPDIDYFMIQIRTKKQQYVLHFTNKRAYGLKIFNYLAERVPSMQV